jgi:enolase-phosphatase E1
MKVILLDIEGTTTPISFVYDKLFPYAKAHLRSFLEAHFHDADVQNDIALLKKECIDTAGDLRAVGSFPSGEKEQIEWTIRYVLYLMECDRKSTGLKSLQGKIWEEGFKNGSLKAIVYSDVLPAFKRWKSQGKKIGIYSSGSIKAQKLLFSHTQEGDLTSFISDYFDTTTGPKIKRESYLKIARSLSVNENEILFVTDAPLEYQTAESAGINVRLCVREEENKAMKASNFHIVRTFDEIP